MSKVVKRYDVISRALVYTYVLRGNKLTVFSSTRKKKKWFDFYYAIVNQTC